MSLEAAITTAGGRFLGEAHGIVWFTDPETQSTLALPAAEVTPDNLALTLLRSRRTFRQEQFRLLIEGLQDYAIFMLDQQGAIISWNAGAERIFDYPAQQIIGQPLATLYFPEEREAGRPQRQLETALREARYEDEALMRRHDDSGFWGDLVVTVLRDEAGQTRGFSYVCRDITRRRQEKQRQHARLCVTRVLSEATDVERTLPLFLQCVCDQLEWDIAEYWAQDPGKDAVTLRALAHHPNFPASLLGTLQPGQEVPLTEALPRHIWQQHPPSLLLHAGLDPNLPPGCFVEKDMKSALVLSLLRQAHPFGFVLLAHRRHRDPDADDIALLEDVVSLLNRYLQQKQAEAELQVATDAMQEQAALLDQILNATSDLIFMFDGRGHYQYLNQPAAAIFGRPPTDIMGKSWRQLQLPEHLMSRFDNERMSVMRTGTPLRAEMTFPTIHHWRDFEYIISPVRGRQGVIESVVVTSRDITERKQAEERLRVMLEQLPAILWTTDQSLRFTSSMGAGLSVFGLRPNQVVGLSIAEFGQDTPFEHAALEAHHKALKGARITYRSFWKDRVLDVWVQPVRDIEGSVTGTIGLALDITEQTAAESPVAEATAAALRSRSSPALESQLLVELNHHLSITAAILEDALARCGDVEHRGTLLQVRDALRAAKTALEQILSASQSTSDAA